MSGRPKPQRRVGVLHADPPGGLSADVRVCRVGGRIPYPAGMDPLLPPLRGLTGMSA